jgi:phosphatidylserine/phosphatidylglycerophosphate/cardiolipin synthase-like enzyme
MSEEGPLLAAISRIADELPFDSAELLANAVAAAPTLESARSRSRGLIPHPRFAERSEALFDAWSACELPPAAVALALRSAARCTREVRAEVRLEPVWTGPPVKGTDFRRSEQVLLEVIRAAQARLLLVSYAVYHHAMLKGALVEAGDRGVAIDVVVESPAESEGRMTADAIKALGPQVMNRCTVLVWPADKRPRDESGNAGVLHAKCVVADRSVLLVSSANLTERAMTSNIELGIVVRGGPLPGDVASAFDELRTRGDLVAVA